MQEMRVQSLGQEDSLEKEITTHSSILALEIPRTEEPGGLQSMGWHRGPQDVWTKQSTPHSAGGERPSAAARLTPLHWLGVRGRRKTGSLRAPGGPRASSLQTGAPPESGATVGGRALGSAA